MATADQLEEAAEGNKFGSDGIPILGKDFNGEEDIDFDDVARPRHPPHGEPGHPGSGWTFEKYLD